MNNNIKVVLIAFKIGFVLLCFFFISIHFVIDHFIPFFFIDTVTILLWCDNNQS